jgi:hypothetical protein
MHPNDHGGSTPIPDPTVLTTAQLVTAIAALRELMLLWQTAHQASHVVLDTNLNLARVDVSRRIDELVKGHAGVLKDMTYLITRDEWIRMHQRLEEQVKENAGKEDTRIRAIENRINQAIGAVGLISIMITMLAVAIAWFKK